MLGTVGEAETNGALEEGDIHDVLRNDRRRLAIKALRNRGGQASVRDLAEEVAARETGEDPPPDNKRQSVYVSLHQTHLPKLDDLGILEYHDDDKTVTLADRVEEVEVYMEVVPRYGLSWGEVYFALGLLGLLTTVAAIVGVPGISTLSIGYIILGYFSLQMVASAYHVYSQQDRVIFHRILE